jgi:hypothetical protein
MKNLILGLSMTLVLLGSQAALAQTAQQLQDGNTTGSTEQLLARVAIDALSTENNYHLDHGTAEKAADLFVEDGVLNGIVGREAIRKFYTARSKANTTRHVWTNARVIFESDSRASGTRILSYYMGEGAGPFSPTPVGIAEYLEVYQRGADGQWRYVSRKIVPVFGKR